MIKTAYISPCGDYRYRLSRIWDEKKPVFGYIGVNPSTADADLDDQTVRKWIGFTERNGGGGFFVVNVFSYRSTDVKKLAEVVDPVGPENMKFIEDIIKVAGCVVPCWGNVGKVPKELRGNFDIVNGILSECSKPVKCFGVTASGSPRHPLMLGYNTELVSYDC